MSQQIYTPAIMKCAKCGSSATLIDWDFRDCWRVMCDKDSNHSAVGENITKNRAVHKWNNKQIKLLGEIK